MFYLLFFIFWTNALWNFVRVHPKQPVKLPLAVREPSAIIRKLLQIGVNILEEKKLTRKQQAEETKRHIFETALQLLAHKKFEEIKVRDIVEAAQVSVGSFYNYYATKLDVFYETYQLADEYFEETVAPQLTQTLARERILFFFDEYARYSSEITDIALTKILYNSNNKFFDRTCSLGIRNVLRNQVEYGLARGEFRCDGPHENMVDFLLIAARGLVYNWCTHDGNYPLRSSMARFVDRLLDAYR